MPKALALEEFAEINARVAEGETRAEVLRAAAIDEVKFEASQAFWLGRMAAEAARHEDTLARRYGALFAEARKRAATPTAPARRIWRLAAPAQVAFGVSGRMADASPSKPGLRDLTAPAVTYAARLTLEQFAALRAEFVLAPEAEHDAVRGRFGLDYAAWANEEAHWQRELASDEALFQRYLRQFQYCRALLTPRG